jgi:hypothetical protein
VKCCDVGPASGARFASVSTVARPSVAIGTSCDTGAAGPPTSAASSAGSAL